MRSPKPCTKDELLEVLQDVLNTVAADDTLEGTLTYSVPTRDEPDCDFLVSASYRVGNSQGQGGIHIVGDGETLDLGRQA